MIRSWCSHANTRGPLFQGVKEAVEFAVPHPYLTQCNILYRRHLDGRDYVDWNDWRDAIFRLGIVERRNMVEFTDMKLTDLGPTAKECDEWLRCRL